MTEHELVQTALAGLHRPSPPPRLRRAVMARIVAEARAEAAAPQVQVWWRTEENGRTVEWRQGGPMPAPPAAPPPLTASSVVRTTRRPDAAGSALYCYTWTR